MSLNDAFFTKYFGSAKLGYHLTDSWSVAAFASGGAAVQTNSSVLCSSATGCANASDKLLWQVPGHVNAVLGAEVAWTPVYGKLNVLAEQVAHFDLSLFAGPDLVTYDEVLSKADAEVLATTGGTPPSASTIGGHFGIGARLFLAQWCALRLDVKDLVYAVKVPNNGSGLDVQNQLFTELGFSVFFPTANRPVR
jgi:outer membrane beta-barrel protein